MLNMNLFRNVAGLEVDSLAWDLYNMQKVVSTTWPREVHKASIWIDYLSQNHSNIIDKQ